MLTINLRQPITPFIRGLFLCFKTQFCFLISKRLILGWLPSANIVLYNYQQEMLALHFARTIRSKKTCIPESYGG